jgi:hypothetical protein
MVGISQVIPLATELEQTPDPQPAAIEGAGAVPGPQLPIYQWVDADLCEHRGTAGWPKSLLPEYRARATSGEGG